jgi:ribosomal protein S18 acetylase RimI-like enzyme
MSGLEVRRATTRDAAGVANVHVHAWLAGYRGLMPDDMLDSLSVEDRTESWLRFLEPGSGGPLVLVASDGEGVAGFSALSLPSRDHDADERTAELSALYVLPPHWREGIGTALLDASRAVLPPEGRWHELTLWVLPDNERALGFYDRHGFAPDGASRREERSGQRVIRLRRAL